LYKVSVVQLEISLLLDYNPDEDDPLPTKPQMSATVYMRTLDNSGL